MGGEEDITPRTKRQFKKEFCNQIKEVQDSVQQQIQLQQAEQAEKVNTMQQKMDEQANNMQQKLDAQTTAMQQQAQQLNDLMALLRQQPNAPQGGGPQQGPPQQPPQPPPQAAPAAAPVQDKIHRFDTKAIKGVEPDCTFQEWRDWRASWMICAKQQSLDKLTRSQQVYSLISVLGPRIQKIIEKHLKINIEDPNVTCEFLLDRFQAHLRSKRNVALDRVAFSERKQRSGETIEEFRQRNIEKPDQ